MRPEFSIAEAHEAIAEAIPEREAVVFRDRRLSYAQWNERTRRLGNYLAGLGLGCHAERYAVPGDRARHLADGSVELHGRDSVTINFGGEKIFAEEVEHALKQHPAVYDAVVAGRPSERWGSDQVVTAAAGVSS